MFPSMRTIFRAIGLAGHKVVFAMVWPILGTVKFTDCQMILSTMAWRVLSVVRLASGKVVLPAVVDVFCTICLADRQMVLATIVSSLIEARYETCQLVFSILSHCSDARVKAASYQQ
jgi:hypothetical protein